MTTLVAMGGKPPFVTSNEREVVVLVNLFVDFCDSIYHHAGVHYFLEGWEAR